MRTLGPAVLLALAVGVGCKPADTPSPSTTPQPSAAIPVAVTEVKFDALDAAVNERTGKVVLMDFWATWCGPCVESFPEFVEAHKKYADRGLVCISVSMDPKGKDDKYNKDAVPRFLQKNGATFTNFVLLGRSVDEERVVRRFGYQGYIPFQVLFDKQGTRVWTNAEQRLSKGELSALIETQLAK